MARKDTSVGDAHHIFRGLSTASLSHVCRGGHLDRKRFSSDSYHVRSWIASSSTNGKFKTSHTRIAGLDRGGSIPTIKALLRIATAAGHKLVITLEQAQVAELAVKRLFCCSLSRGSRNQHLLPEKTDFFPCRIDGKSE